MGVSTGQWLAAVGRWAGARGVTLCCFGESESSGPPGFFGLVLATLLLVSGVEPNPGPVDKCRCEPCGALFTALSEEVEKRERAVSEKERSLLELERQLKETDRQLNDKQKLLETRTNKFQDREEDVKEREVVLEKKECVLAKREGQISERECQISERERLVSGREALISDREHKISGRESVVSQRESLSREYEAPSIKNGSLVSERSGVDSDSRSSSEREMGVECKGDAVLLLPELLLAAAAAGRLEDVRACLEGGRMHADRRNQHVKNALFLAAMNGHLSVVRYLVSKGWANVFAMDDDRGVSAIDFAAQFGHLHVVLYLVKEAGAYINIETSFPETELHLAVRMIKSEMIMMECLQFLMEQGKADVRVWRGLYNIALHDSARAGNVEGMRLMVQVGKVDFGDKGKHWGHSILARAAGKGHLSVVRFLVEQAKADPNARRNDREQTALHKAVAGQHLEVVKYLVEEAGASLTAEVDYSNIVYRGYCTPAQVPTSPAITRFLSGAN